MVPPKCAVQLHLMCCCLTETWSQSSFTDETSSHYVPGFSCDHFPCVLVQYTDEAAYNSGFIYWLVVQYNLHITNHHHTRITQPHSYWLTGNPLVIGISMLKTIIRAWNLDTDLTGYEVSHRILPTLRTPCIPLLISMTQTETYGVFDTSMSVRVRQTWSPAEAHWAASSWIAMARHHITLWETMSLIQRDKAHLSLALGHQPALL